ncbi:MAG TPA: hypothetical protein VLD39_02440 [Gammaproteobacteria bacterium]|nr:hypothetical protein [Gammaproteobacteria bacterium]
MSSDARDADWLEEIRELNRLFLNYLLARCEAGRPCPGLPRRVAHQLAEASPAALERLAALPTGLFRLAIESGTGARDGLRPVSRIEQLRVSLALTILSSAWHMARSRSFEARAFLHLSERELRRLRAMPLSLLPLLAGNEDLLQCAFADAGLTWSALVGAERQDPPRMLILIALQPDLALGSMPPKAMLQPGARSLA